MKDLLQHYAQRKQPGETYTFLFDGEKVACGGSCRFARVFRRDTELRLHVDGLQGAGIYARTMEWGASDLHSQMVLVPRGTKFSSELAVDKTGMTWKTKYGYVGIIGTGETYKAIVKLTFAKGASLDDPSRLFNSSHEGNTRRAIDIHEGDRIDEKASKAPILAAVALNTSKKSAARANFTRR